MKQTSLNIVVQLEFTAIAELSFILRGQLFLFSI